MLYVAADDGRRSSVYPSTAAAATTVFLPTVDVVSSAFRPADAEYFTCSLYGGVVDVVFVVVRRVQFSGVYCRP